MIRATLSVLLLSAALPLLADRVRVIVAVDETVPSAGAVASERARVIESLTTATEVEQWGEGRAFVAEIDSSELELLRRDARVRAISFDAGGRGALLESVPLIHADLARSSGFDGHDVTVAVLDSGIDVNHPDFAGRVVAEQCFCDNRDGTGCCPNGAKVQSGRGAAQDDNGHGTHVSGIIGGGGIAAPRGVAPAVKIVAIKVLSRENAFASLTQIYRALEWIVQNRPDVRVINMSLGTWAQFTSSQCAASAEAHGFEGVLQQLRSRGVVLTASSGNDGSVDAMQFPACHERVLAIGATYDAPSSRYEWLSYACTDNNASRDQVACFSNSSDGLDLLAPGAPILASRLRGGSRTMIGTSMASPHVAGALALMMQASQGTISASQAEEILRTTGVRVTDSRNGLAVPRIDVAAAVSATPRPAPGRRRRAAR